MSRRDAREIAFKLIFEYDFNKRNNSDVYEEYVASLSDDDKAYVNEVYYGVVAHYDEIKQKLEEVIEKFSFDRLFKVDNAILFLALYEILFVDSIPYKVSVDEALNLAEQYSTGKSVKYINGVLSKFAR